MFFALRIVTRDTPVIGRKPETAHISEQLSSTGTHRGSKSTQMIKYLLTSGNINTAVESDA